ncbi:hypothetical protein BRAS3843_3420024 [Bradyrhizobium sp. STM 3843]|nr:hypothetical protein BRAS3843_3420024 [Bradyrhizobium sp. STM 3843]
MFWRAAEDWPTCRSSWPRMRQSAWKKPSGARPESIIVVHIDRQGRLNAAAPVPQSAVVPRLPSEATCPP